MKTINYCLNPKTIVLLLLAITLSSGTVDFCTIRKSIDTIPMMPDEKHVVNLADYIRGFDLEFDTNNSQIATAWNPVNQISTQQSPFDDGYKIVNVDILESTDKKWSKQGIVFAQKDDKSVGISTALYSGTKSKRENTQVFYFTLPKQSKCFSAQIIDEQFNTALDCQTISEDESEDLICYINIKSKQISCTSLDSLAKTQSRKSQTLTIKNEIFLITGTYSHDPKTQDLTYLTIYHISEDYIDFVNIIDGYQLGLGTDIIISDFDIASDGNILVNDLKTNTIHTVKYTLPNQINKILTFQLTHAVNEFQITTFSTILISTGVYVMQYDLVTMKPGARYELDKADNQIVNIQASVYAVTIQTSKGSLYVYQPLTAAINYVLAEVDISNKDYLLAPYSNALYLFDEKKQYIHEISAGYLVLSNINQDTNLIISAKSSQISCSVNINILKQSSPNNIITKQNISMKHFKIQSDQQLTVNLDDIYSGSNLKYTAPQSTQKVSYSLQHLEQFKVVSEYENSSISQVVGVDRYTFMLIKFIGRTSIIQKCELSQADSIVYCKMVYNQTQPVDQTPVLVSGKQRANNDLLFAWAYTSGKVGLITYRNDKFSAVFIFTGYQYDYSSIVISESKVFFVMKAYSLVQVIDDMSNGYKIFVISKDNFKSTDPNIKGFYPRQIYAHPKNKDLFYIRFPTSLCLMTFIGVEPNTIECNLMIEKIVPSDKWDVVIGARNMVVFTPDQIKEYSTFGNLPIELHLVDLAGSLPMGYSQFTNTFILKTNQNSQNKIVYYKLGKPVIDSLYYSGEQSSDFSSEGYWAYMSTSGNIYRQSINSRLQINSTFEQTDFKQDFKFTLKVSSTTSAQISDSSDIVVYNYPTQISSINNTNEQIKLPKSPSTPKKIPIQIQKYFKGIRQSYQLSCDYCGKQIRLQTMFRNQIYNTEIHGADAIVEVEEKNVLILSDNRINFVDNMNVKQDYTVIRTERKCTAMGYHLKVGVLVFCQSPESQQVHLFSLTGHSIQFKSIFLLHEQSAIQTADEIIITLVNENQAIILIEDNDVSNLNDNVNKHANVKAFILTMNQDHSQQTFEFKGVISSTSFGLASSQPINDIDVDEQGKFIFATIGNIGLGFAKLQISVDNILSDPQIIDFNTLPQLSHYILDDSIYQQVQITDYSATINKITLFVTSTTSLHMVINFSYQNAKVSLLNVAETYNRYGHMTSLNWQFITKDYVLLAYYNSNINAEIIVYYPRGEQGYVDFIGSLKVIITTQQLLEHFVFLSSDLKLYVADVGRQATDSKLTMYEVTPGFNLVASYSAAGSFDTISIKASNNYNNASMAVNVQFEGGDDDDQGIKWYTIMIVSLLVLLVVGISYGMYLKMLKNRKDKKVSLLTEGEADEEV